MSERERGAPLVLGVDTATDVASWALWRGEDLVAERAVAAGRATAEGLLPALDALLGDAGVDLDAMDAFAVSIGPGSFTGLRIGVATVKGLAFDSARPALAVPTLAAVAGHAGSDGKVVALLDARRGEVYAQGFERVAGEGVPAAWLPEGVVHSAELARFLPADCTVVGEGIPVCAGALAQTGAVVLPPPYPATTARQVAALGARHLARGGGCAVGELVPRYVRRAEAEVKRTGERFEPAGGSF